MFFLFCFVCLLDEKYVNMKKREKERVRVRERMREKERGRKGEMGREERENMQR